MLIAKGQESLNKVYNLLFFFFYSVKLVRKLDGTEVLREYVIIESVWSVQRQSRVDYTIIGRF